MWCQSIPRSFLNAFDVRLNGKYFFDILEYKNLRHNIGEALLSYCFIFHDDFNNYARIGPQKSHSPSYRTWCARENAFISLELQDHRVHRPFIAYKSIDVERVLAMQSDWGRRLGATMFGPNLVGSTLKNRGFLSTSVLRGRVLPDRPVLLKITMPLGAHGAAIWDCSEHPEEMEFLLDRNHELRITNVRRKHHGAHAWVVDCRVVQQFASTVSTAYCDL